MKPTPLSRDQVQEILGDIDDVTAARIIATDADLATLVRALHDVEQTFMFGEPSVAIPNDPTYIRVREVLLEMMVDDDDLAYVDYATD